MAAPDPKPTGLHGKKGSRLRSKELENIVRLLQASEQRTDRPALETVDDWRRSYERLTRSGPATG